MLVSTPDEVELHDDAGVLALLLGRPAVAVGHFRASATRRPESAAAHYNLGTALTSAGLFDDAVASYERALAMRPGYAKALQQPRRHAGGVGRTGEAMARYEAAIGRRADDARAAQQPRRRAVAARRPRRGPSASCDGRCACVPAMPTRTSTSGTWPCAAATFAAAAAPLPPGGGQPRRLGAGADHGGLGAGDSGRRARCVTPAEAVRLAERAPWPHPPPGDPRALDMLAVALASARPLRRRRTHRPRGPGARRRAASRPRQSPRGWRCSSAAKPTSTTLTVAAKLACAGRCSGRARFARACPDVPCPRVPVLALAVRRLAATPSRRPGARRCAASRPTRWPRSARWRRSSAPCPTPRGCAST